MLKAEYKHQTYICENNTSNNLTL